jgi:hypothetical protein
MNEKDLSGRECNEWVNEMFGLRGEVASQDHGHTSQERQGSVLTNQCLGIWKRVLSDELRNPST